MCGIAGLVGKKKIDIEGRIQNMLPFLKERGPDQNKFKIYKNVALGHTRLSIIDLSDTSSQPFETKHSTIVFNGEIYNFKELRNELIREGAEFHSQGDTEVIVKSYEFWGLKKTLTSIKGMFAFSLLDKKKNIIYFARDPFGKKPLYISEDYSKIVFSSDIRAVKSQLEKCSINFNSVEYYFSEMYIPQSQSIYNEIFQLKPGSFKSYDLENKSWSEISFFDFSENLIDFSNASEDEIISEVDKTLTKSVKSRLVSDVPIGAFLSGGVDSGLIVSKLAEQVEGRVNTYTVGFEEKEFDERILAKKVAEKFNTNHHELVAKDFHIPDLIEKLVDYIGEPHADPSIIPTFIVSQAISKNIKVALSGDGGDELFGGYNDYFIRYNAQKFDKLNFIKKSKLIGFDFWKRINQRPGNNAKLFQSLSSEEDYLWFYRNMAFHPNSLSETLGLTVNGTFRNTITNILKDLPNFKNEILKLELGSLKTRLLGDYLVKVDRMSMLNSLEIRSPFLDEELAKVAFSIPSEIKYKKQKYILKQLVHKKYDNQVFYRKKSGFSPPILNWLRNDLKPLLYNYVLSDKFLLTFNLNKNKIEKIIKNLERVDESSKLWTLLVLAIWNQKRR